MQNFCEQQGQRVAQLEKNTQTELPPPGNARSISKSLKWAAMVVSNANDRRPTNRLCDRPVCRKSMYHPSLVEATTKLNEPGGDKEASQRNIKVK
jgi:hypothetical protein